MSQIETTAPALASEAQLRTWVDQLCGIDRVAGSDGERRAAGVVGGGARAPGGGGERRAAELVAAELRAAGGRVSVERERVHGTYWWPVGLPTAVAGLAALRGGRAAVVTGILAAAAVADDITVGHRLLRRRLPKREATNVIAEFGDPDADDVLLVVAHHDAPH